MTFKNTVLRITNVVYYFGVLLFFGMTIVCFIQIVYRYVLSNALIWPEESIRFMFIWMAYIGMFYAVQSDAHLKVDILANLMGKRKRCLLGIINTIITFLFMSYICWHSLIMVIRVSESGQVALTLPVPLVLVWASLPFCFGLSALLCLVRLENYMAELRTMADPPTGEVK